MNNKKETGIIQSLLFLRKTGILLNGVSFSYFN